MKTYYTTYTTGRGDCGHRHGTLFEAWECQDRALYRASHTPGRSELPVIQVVLEDGSRRSLTPAERDECDGYNPDYH